MCGIAGWLSWSGATDESVVSRMRDTLSHRGPDDSGTWTSTDRRVCLGHRRLSILDLSSAGHQPMIRRSGQRSLTFNGEIYNLPELRSELSEHGHSFTTRTDTEIILAAYEQWGREFVQHLDGMFAFALYDADRGHVLLARDRAGEKPLYTYTYGTGFLFASEVKGLLAHPLVSRTIDRVALDRYLAYGYVPPERGLIAGTAQLSPAHAMLIDVQAGTKTTWRYWHLPEQSHRALTLEDAVDRTEELLGHSVRRQLVSDVPVAVLLSGGLDSSLITALAVRHTSTLQTFTVRFAQASGLDEGTHAAAVAQHFGTAHHEVDVHEPDPDVLCLLARQFDEPVGDSAIVSSYLLAKAVRAQATVALGGDGGDELFAGYPFHSEITRLATVERYAPKAIRAAVRTVAKHGIPHGVRGRNYAITMTSDVPDAIAHATSYWDPEARAALLIRPTAEPSNGSESPEEWRMSLASPGGSALRRLLEADFQSSLAHQYLPKVDRTGMLVSLENRSPMLDRALIEFVFRDVPDHLKATGTERKIILRQLARRLLPASFNSERKQGFGIPFAHWLRGSWGKFTKDILLGADPNLFRPATVRRMVEGQLNGRSNTRMVFSLLMFELWRREYQVSA